MIASCASLRVHQVSMFLFHECAGVQFDSDVHDTMGVVLGVSGHIIKILAIRMNI